MRSSPPPPQPPRPEKSPSLSSQPSSKPVSPRPKESSFLKSIGLELSSFGFGSSSSSSSVSAKKAAAPSKPAAAPVAVEGRRSHRPAPKAPGEQPFPGVKLRSRDTLLPPKEEEQLLDEQDFDDLTVLLEGASDEPAASSSSSSFALSRQEQEEDEDLSKMSSDDLEKNLMRMSLSELAPTVDAPPPPPLSKKKSSSSVTPSSSSVAAQVAAVDPVIVTVEVPVKDAKAEEELLASKKREADLEARLSEMERLARQIEADSKQRIQELEMQLDALIREKESREAQSAQQVTPEQQGPTREELMAAMDAYRSKLSETDQELQKSEERKNQLRDDLRKLISKSKEIESNAKSWKERCESFETKFTKTKALAREYAERCKALEKKEKSEPPPLDHAELEALERRAKKAEEMAKLAVGVIKKSGNSELRKELAVALQGLQQAKIGTVEAKSDRRKSPREPLAKVDVSEGKQQDEVPRKQDEVPRKQDEAPRKQDELPRKQEEVSTPPVIKSPRLEVLNMSSSTSVMSPQVGRKQKVEEKTSLVSKTSSPPSASPQMSRNHAAAARSESEPKMLAIPPSIKAPDTMFMSPQVDRKQKFVVASAGGSKTPTVLRKKEPESIVQASPSVQRRNNPGRSERSPPPQARKEEPPKKEEQKKEPVKAAVQEGDDAFSLLEGMLKEVEKETGQKGLSGPVDNSLVFETSGDASSYLASIKQEASAEHVAIEKEKARKMEEQAQAKRDELLAASTAARDAHRNLLSRYLDEEANYIEAQLRDPLHPSHSLVALLNRAEKVQSDAERNALLDEASDVDFVGSELVLRVQLIEARDLDASLAGIYAVLSVTKQQQSSVVIGQLPANGVAQWNETFLFSSAVDASSRLTVTLMGSNKTRLGVAQIQLRELRGCGKEYFPIVDNSKGTVIRGMLTAAVSLHFKVVKKSPVTVKLDPNSKSYQDAVRHNVALIRKCDENKPREREFNASLKLSALQKEMDVPKPNFGWLASQLRSGAVKGDDPFENVYRRTLLHLMVIAGDIEMVEVCFAAGADPKKRDCFGLLPFHLAIVHGHLKLLQNMLPVMRAFGQSVHTPENAAGLPPVHLAAIFNRPKILEWLLDQGADVDDKDDFGSLPIHKAAFVGSLGCVQALVNRRAFVKAEDADGNTPLLLAMKEGHWDVADYLLTNQVQKADLSTVNLAGDSPLLFAALRSNKRFTKLCLDSPHSNLAAVYGRNKWTLLMRAINDLDESDEVIKLIADAMVARGMGLNQRAADGKTAAFVCVFNGKVELLKWLLMRGLDLLCQDDNGNNCLHFAGSIDVAQVLLEAGVDVNSKNHQGNTPLHSSYAFSGETIDLLLNNRANPNIRNNSNKRPCDAVGKAMEMSFDGSHHNASCGLFIQ